jgi:formylglycine-generating enzyme required for sulfatase activity
MANTWQGEFPVENLGLDGHEYTAPVRSFPPNSFRLFEMTGNVWEWTVDGYRDHAAGAPACCAVTSPPGDLEGSYDPLLAAHPPRIARKVIKGGSHLCAENYCRRYRPAARMPQAIDTSTSHLGFRCIVRPMRVPAHPGRIVPHVDT